MQKVHSIVVNFRRALEHEAQLLFRSRCERREANQSEVLHPAHLNSCGVARGNGISLSLPLTDLEHQVC